MGLPSPLALAEGDLSQQGRPGRRPYQKISRFSSNGWDPYSVGRRYLRSRQAPDVTRELWFIPWSHAVALSNPPQAHQAPLYLSSGPKSGSPPVGGWCRNSTID